MPKKAVFFDRDGVINDNSEHYYIYKTEDFKINEGVIESLKYYYDNDFLIIIISNQGGIAKNIYSKNDVEKLHQYFNEYLLKLGIKIDAFYYCPHHNSISECICRKPNNVLIEKAIASFDVDRSISILIGDSDRDIEAAEKSGIKAYKVAANKNIYNQLKNFGLIN